MPQYDNLLPYRNCRTLQLTVLSNGGIMFSRANRKKLGENLLQCHSVHHDSHTEVIRDKSRVFAVRSHRINVWQIETSGMSEVDIGYFIIATNQ